MQMYMHMQEYTHVHACVYVWLLLGSFGPCLGSGESVGWGVAAGWGEVRVSKFLRIKIGENRSNFGLNGSRVVERESSALHITMGGR